MIRKSGNRFSEKIMRKQKARAGCRLNHNSSRSSCEIASKPPRSPRLGVERGAISSRPGGEDEGGFGRPFFSTEVRYMLTAADFRLEQLRCLQVP
jgi:hypothetical protein